MTVPAVVTAEPILSSILQGVTGPSSLGVSTKVDSRHIEGSPSRSRDTPSDGSGPQARRTSVRRLRLGTGMSWSAAYEERRECLDCRRGGLMGWLRLDEATRMSRPRRAGLHQQKLMADSDAYSASGFLAPIAFNSPMCRTTIRWVSAAKSRSAAFVPDFASLAKAAPSAAWMASISFR
jgi:hypothetical protein